MSGTVATQTPTKKTRQRATSGALWAVQALLGLSFVSGGILKVSGDPAMVELFTTIGAGQWLRYLVGALEIAGGVGVLIPRLSGLAALGLVALMVGATVTNLFVIEESPWVPIGFLLASVLVARGRWSKTAALASAFRN
jgi:uncharacterized membrane protein YphA (DoxX/SURF4 family)